MKVWLNPANVSVPKYLEILHRTFTPFLKILRENPDFIFGGSPKSFYKVIPMKNKKVSMQMPPSGETGDGQRSASNLRHELKMQTEIDASQKEATSGSSLQ
jgi:hypothetical protein